MFTAHIKMMGKTRIWTCEAESGTEEGSTRGRRGNLLSQKRTQERRGLGEV